MPRPSSRFASPRPGASVDRDRRRPEVLHGQGSPLRIGPWQGAARVAAVAPVHGGVPCAVADVRAAVAALAGQGYESIVTAALAPLDQAAFLTAGFAVRERLHLLARPLPAAAPPPAPPGVELRRAQHRHRGAVLALDHRAFEPFWRLDANGLVDALAATPSSRFRVAVTDAGATPTVVGYSVIGRASHRGYVQRLAVEPGRQRHGLGRALLLDGLRWLGHRRVRRVMVNTQECNGPALALYEREGFERQPGGLAVLSLSLVDRTPPGDGA